MATSGAAAPEEEFNAAPLLRLWRALPTWGARQGGHLFILSKTSLCDIPPPMEPEGRLEEAD